MRRGTFAFLLCVALISTAADAQPTYYVDVDATGANTGTSWADAFTNPQSALTIAQYGDEIWVAEGTYKPIVPANPPNVPDPERNTPFRVLNGVRFIGGFNGTESSLDQRNWEAHPTILSGDLLGDDNDIIQVLEPTRVDNSWHVVAMGHIDSGSVDNNTLVDGFTITGGNADPPMPNPDDDGGGIKLISNPAFISSPVIQNVILRENSAHYGGGFGCVDSQATLLNVHFINNSALGDGGGANLIVCEVVMRKVHFENNIAGLLGGGLMANRGASSMAGGVFINNAANRGGGAYSLLDATYIVNAKFLNNRGYDAAGGYFIDNSPAAVMNTIFSNNAAENVDTDRIGGGAAVILGGSIDQLTVPFLVNNVFYGNSTAADGGAIATIGSEAIIANSILWNNSAQQTENEVRTITQFPIRLPFLIANIVQGPLPDSIYVPADPAFQNRDVNPDFVDPDGLDDELGTIDDDFQLASFSPAIDAGFNDILLFDFLDLDGDGITSQPGNQEVVPVDFAGNIRVFDGSGLGGAPAVDLGVFEYGAPKQNPNPTDIQTDTAELPVVPLIVDAYPNPFKTNATIRYELPESGRVRIRVYDALGRKVATIVDAVQPAGVHEARFRAPDLASGFYLFRLEMGDATSTRKMTLIK